MKRDLLRHWWQHATTIERYEGESSVGDVYGQAEGRFGFWDDAATSLIVTVAGEDTKVNARVYYPIGVDEIPLNSKITAPASKFSKVGRVIGVSVHEMGGNMNLPEHVEVLLE